MLLMVTLVLNSYQMFMKVMKLWCFRPLLCTAELKTKGDIFNSEFHQVMFSLRTLLIRGISIPYSFKQNQLCISVFLIENC